eukprot:3771273-Amphidinium_carterae.1
MHELDFGGHFVQSTQETTSPQALFLKWFWAKFDDLDSAAALQHSHDAGQHSHYALFPFKSMSGWFYILGRGRALIPKMIPEIDRAFPKI